MKELLVNSTFYKRVSILINKISILTSVSLDTKRNSEENSSNLNTKYDDGL